MPYTPPDYSVPPVPAPSPIHAARERAVTLLTDRFADDSISEAEFEARLSWLSAAESVERINELVSDLAVPRMSLTGSQYALAPLEESRITAIMSSTERNGHWAMPTRLKVRAVMSELKLDLRFATLPPFAEIDLFALMANVKIIVPPEVEVQSSVTSFMASARNEADSRQWAGAPILRVTGSCTMAELKIVERARRR